MPVRTTVGPRQWHFCGALSGSSGAFDGTVVGMVGSDVETLTCGTAGGLVGCLVGSSPVGQNLVRWLEFPVGALVGTVPRLNDGTLVGSGGSRTRGALVAGWWHSWIREWGSHTRTTERVSLLGTSLDSPVGAHTGTPGREHHWISGR
jgi:hypothetical protein